MGTITESAKAFMPKLSEIRRDFHMHPEVSQHEERTGKKVAEYLKEMGCDEVYENVGGYGVVGVIKGKKPGKVVALRADMDALQIQEMNEVPYKSQNDGVMHACGHDNHMTGLLGAAMLLCERREEIAGTVKLIFQPAEEMSPVGGSRGMLHSVYKIAEGAAHMTETRVEIDFVKGCSNLMSNKVIAKELWDNLVELGAPEYTEEEMKFAKAISEGVGDSRFESLEKIAKNCKDKAAKAEVLSHKGESMYRFVAPFNPDGIMSFGSTDVGDVSWNCPTAQAYVATWAAGTPGHSWQVVSQGKSGLAHKGLIYAAKAMAGAAIDMYEDPEIIAKAKAEMEEELDGDTYHCPIPDGCKPRALGMKM